LFTPAGARYAVLMKISLQLALLVVLSSGTADCKTFDDGGIRDITRDYYRLTVKDGPDGPGEYIFSRKLGEAFGGTVTYQIKGVKITVFQAGRKLFETRIKQFHAAVNTHDAAWIAAMKDNCSHKWFADSHVADCSEVK
jgi:hypothetical protein